MGCFGGFGGNNCWWIIILILLVCCCGCGSSCGVATVANNGCGCNPCCD